MIPEKVQLQHYIQSDQVPGAEIFHPPSDEATWWVSHAPWLVAPAEGQPSLLSRMVGVIVVAPFTQFTLFSYELQAFLFEIFHQTRIARIGHFIFGIAVNYFLMAGLLHVTPLTGLPLPEFIGSLRGADLYAGTLMIWYALMAKHTRMYLWGILMMPMVLLLLYAAGFFPKMVEMLHLNTLSLPLWNISLGSPWLWMWVSAFMIALSHAPEPKLPPRVTESLYWKSIPEYILGTSDEQLSRGTQLFRVFRVFLQSIWGTLDELWASPRLMPYNILMLMFRFGYRSEEANRLQGYVQKALASGNPALDYVGIGGGTYLRRRSA